jgi:hypothetical protein
MRQPGEVYEGPLYDRAVRVLFAFAEKRYSNALMPDWFYIRPELLLFAVALILYLHDQATRLYANEILFYRSGRGRWVAKAADRYPEFGRHYLAFVRPWRPDTTIVKASWPRATGTDQDRRRALQESIQGVENRLRFLRNQCTPLLITLFVGVPFAHIFYGSGALLIGILVAYVQVILMLGSLLSRRRELGLPWKSVGLIVFESLICIPYAINLYRKVADRLVPVNAEPIDLAMTLLDAGACTALRQNLLRSIGQRINLTEEGDAKQVRLMKYRERLQQESAA